MDERELSKGYWAVKEKGARVSVPMPLDRLSGRAVAS